MRKLSQVAHLFECIMEMRLQLPNFEVYKFTKSSWRRHLAPTNSTDPDVKARGAAGGGGERQGFSQIQLSMEKKKRKGKERMGEMKSSSSSTDMAAEQQW